MLLRINTGTPCRAESQQYNHKMVKLKEKELRQERNAYEKEIYQIDKNGEIINKYSSIQLIEGKYTTIYNSIKNQKLYKDTLLVFVKDYKTTINYVVLIKYIKYLEKQKKGVN